MLHVHENQIHGVDHCYKRRFHDLEFVELFQQPAFYFAAASHLLAFGSPITLAVVFPSLMENETSIGEH